MLVSSFLLCVAATPVEHRQSPPGEVSSFTAHTNPYGNDASIGYDFELAGRVTTHCNYSVITSDATVPVVPLIHCDNTTVQWEFFHEPPQGAPYRLVIVYTPETGPETYSQALPETDFAPVSFNSRDGFVYVGEPKFEAYRVE
ncbi:hypothetical protein O1611_g3750 [Lasiodiplodia mahajangana]|uniref:Uncharacterized protein n=1 Tax=Lasiodiplodia mahajangana TaxID=1108764 RepID=A0ACC2JR11_9PEZI|nr:hypothetical protein O1611_g3750 [Lasiodiplodia mahajangana]